MNIAKKRFHMSLTKEDIKNLDYLIQHFGESKNQVLRRGLILLYYITTKEDSKDASVSIV